MRDYELTDRGKILIAVVIAVLFLLIPAGILVFSAFADRPPNEPDAEASGAPPASNVEADPSQPLNSPPPTGGDFNPPDVQPTESGDSQTDVKDPADPVDAGLVIGGNPSEGTLSFLFLPGASDTLDDETLAALDMFVSAPWNSDKNRIVVELPHAPGNAEDMVISAIISAFSERGILEQRLVFIVSPDSMEDGLITVNMYYVPYETK